MPPLLSLVPFLVVLTALPPAPAQVQPAAAGYAWPQRIVDAWQRWLGAAAQPAATEAGSNHQTEAPAAPAEAARPAASFDDIAGAENAKAALKEFAQAVGEPGAATLLGAVPAKGILLVGPPGVGKTLLARATLAAVPAHTIVTSGPELLADGAGQLRLHALFAEARKKAPTVVFIDEMEAVAEHPAHSKALGIALDGFLPNAEVYVIAAVNTLSGLSPALLRAGRFDQVVFVPPPNRDARAWMLGRSADSIAQAADVDLAAIANTTAGLSGAELVNLANLATARAARGHKTAVEATDWDEAFDDLRWGPADRTRHYSDAERFRTAVHEAGHAGVALLTNFEPPVRKVSIIAREVAEGYTDFVSADDPPVMDQPFWRHRIAVTMAGRAAEQHLLGYATPGVSKDLDAAYAMARLMATAWGMDDGIGPMGLPWANDPAAAALFSDAAKQEVDEAIRSRVEAEYANALDLVKEHSGAITSLAKALLACLALSGEEAKEAMAGQLPARCQAPLR